MESNAKQKLDMPGLCRAIAESSLFPIAAMEGASHIIRYVNPAFCLLVGEREEKLIGSPFPDTLPTDDAFLSLLDRVYRTGKGEAYTGPEQLTPASFWSCAMWPALAADGHAIGIIIQVTDTKPAREQAVAMNQALMLSSVHQQELTEAADKRSTNLQTEITQRSRMEQALDDVIARFNPDLRYTYVNASLEKKTGLKREAMVGATPNELGMPALFVDRLAREVNRVIETRRPDVAELSYPTPGGTTHWEAKFIPEFGESGAVVSVLHIARNITEEKRLEQAAEAKDSALRESEERFRSMADTAPVMIWVSGTDKLYTFVNQGWLTFTGRTMRQELGDGWATNIHPEDLNRCLDIYSTSFEARRSFQMEYRLRRADGEYRWVLDNGVPRFESSGVFVGCVGSCVDITDLKRAHDEDLTKQRLETVGTLASSIAHDFNNLLGGILAHAELALGDLAEGSQPEEDLQRIRDAAIRGAEIVRQLMVYAGEDANIFEPVDVSEIVKNMLELLKVSVSKYVLIETDLGTQLPTVQANPSQIRQVVMNLFTNASEAIGNHNGVIRVTTSRVTVSGDSSVATSERLPDGDYVQLEVSDTGTGMTPAVQARIFDLFFTTKLSGSHGLGLSGLKAIVQNLHGGIRVSSAPGKGSAFQVLLPCAEKGVEEAPSVVARPDGETLASQGVILVVEDEDLLRQGVSKMLQKRGFSVLEASDGSSALDMVREWKDKIDLLLLDITLPGAPSRNVYEEAKRLRPDLPVIVTSAKSEEMAAGSLGTGIQRFLRKPFSLGDLVEMVRQSLSS